MSEDVARNVKIIWSLVVRVVLLVAGVYLAIRYGPHVLHRLEPIFISVVASVALTYVLLPAVERLSRIPCRFWGRKTQRLLAAVLVFLVFLGLTVLSIFLFITPFQNELEQFSASLRDYTIQLGELFQSANRWYQENVPAQIRNLVGKLDYGRVFAGITDSVQRVFKLATSSVQFVLELVLIPVLALYFVLDYKSISRDFYGLLPVHKRREAIIIGRSIGEILQSYIFGQLVLCAIAGILTCIVLAAMGLPYVIVLALFAGVTRAIPIIGPVVSGIPIVLVGLLNSPGSLIVPIELTVFVVVMHFIESKFILPKLLGRRLHLHPAIVIIALLVGAEFLGIVGMFIAVPVAAIVRELLRFYYIKPGIKTLRAQKEEGLQPPVVAAS
jgi:predicted PurR-regulated permease PerM